jgi:sec-independent protein translocase protein TatA
MPQLGPSEILIIGLLAVLFFGKDKLPELAKSIGVSFKELKKGLVAEEVQPQKSETSAVSSEIQ